MSEEDDYGTIIDAHSVIELFTDANEIGPCCHVATNISCTFAWFFRLLSEVAL